MKEVKLQTQPYKGARDFYPEDMRVRNYIFDNWRKVCRKYGYEEYDGPFLESFDIYAAKSGEELVNEQLYSFEDRGKRKVAIRPEMTPTLARMVSQKYGELVNPIRWFSIPNLWRYEKPQKGRLREHFQLNVDIFGVENALAEAEILSVVVDILKQFGAKENMFEIRLGNRRFLNDVFNEIGVSPSVNVIVVKAIDKMQKLSAGDFEKILAEDAKLSSQTISKLKEFIKEPRDLMKKLLPSSIGAQEVTNLLELCKNQGIEKFVRYDPSIVRGLDYYTGSVFELFDLTPENQRAMAGGGRYDNLVETFIGKKLSGIGFGMGDVTFKNFLENWGLLPSITPDIDYFISVWPSENPEFMKISLETAKTLRKAEKNVITWTDNNSKLDKQLKYADKKGARFVVIIGENELKTGEITIKDLTKKTQVTKPLAEFFEGIK